MVPQRSDGRSNGSCLRAWHTLSVQLATLTGLLLLLSIVISTAWASHAGAAQAANLDTIADHVFGQPDFTHNDYNHGGLSDNSLDYPNGVALDKQGNLYVVDTSNNRVLEYDAPLTNGMAASRVFGQPDFIHNSVNNGGVTANSLNFPMGIALDAQGNLYVADTINSRVLEYDTPLSSGMVASRVFGQPDFLHNSPNNGGVSANSLNFPMGVALDAQGNLYVTDYHNNRVLEYGAPLTNGMAASRVFGQPDFTSNSSNNGGVTATSLSIPYGVALDAQGNLYVADYGNNRVLEYDRPLTSDTAADRVVGQPDFTSNSPNNGGVTASAKSLSWPTALALDARVNLYVVDYSNNRVLEYDTPLTGDTTADRVFGQPDFTSDSPNYGGDPSTPEPTAVPGGVSANGLNEPHGVALDAQGNLYVADTANSRVLEYDVPVPHGVPAVAALSPSMVAAGSAALTLTVDGADFVPGSIVRWNSSDRPTTFLNSTQLNATISAADVAAGGPFAVTVFTPTPGGGTSGPVNLPLYSRAGQDATADVVQGQPNFALNSANNPLLPDGASRLNAPTGLAVAGQSGRLFVADSSNNRVLSWPNAPALANGQPADLVLGQPNFVARSSNNGGVRANSLFDPLSVALDRQGNLYVADLGNNRVLEYNAPLTSGMAASRVFGQGGSFTTALPNNGGVSANSLQNPYGMALDAHGDLYVADANNNRVLEYDTPLSAGTTADRVFGQPDFSHNTANNGGLSANSLFLPLGVATDNQGHLYVADTYNNRVLQYDAPLTGDHTADRVFGQPDFTTKSPNNGGVSANGLDGPYGVALDGLGKLYVADDFNNRVLEYDAPLTTDRTADRVFGQPVFSLNTANNGGVSASSLDAPGGVAVDAQGNLYVADTNNSRVLEYVMALFKINLPLALRGR